MTKDLQTILTHAITNTQVTEELDTIGLLIPYKIKPKSLDYNNPYINLCFIKRSSSYLLKFGSKLLNQNDSLQGYNISNIEKVIPVLNKNLSFTYFTLETLLNSQVYWVDVKVDVNNTTNVSTEDFMSILRDLSSTKTNKLELLEYKRENKSFIKGIGYNKSLLIKSTCKTVNDSLMIYPKIEEIYNLRHKDPEYYNRFSTEFKIKNANLIRFERRLQNSRNIKKAYGLTKRPLLLDILTSSRAVVSQRVHELFIN